MLSPGGHHRASVWFERQVAWLPADPRRRVYDGARRAPRSSTIGRAGTIADMVVLEAHGRGTAPAALLTGVAGA
ncbi:MAG: hypothetical protein R3C32_13545 [Chloroflexota bacterium]